MRWNEQVYYVLCSDCGLQEENTVDEFDDWVSEGDDDYCPTCVGQTPATSSAPVRTANARRSRSPSALPRPHVIQRPEGVWEREP